MTNKEAVELLKELENEVYNEDRNGYKQYEALDLAIKALERDGTIAFEDDEPTVCTCPVCGSIWKKVETNKREI